MTPPRAPRDAPQMNAHQTLLILTGTMRSGTTLMGELLYSRAYGRECHPNLSFANDSFDTLRDLLYRVRETVDPSKGAGHPYGTLQAPLSLTADMLAEQWPDRPEPDAIRKFHHGRCWPDCGARWCRVFGRQV